MKRYNVELSPEQAEWLEGYARQNGWKIRDAFRRIVDDSRLSSALGAPAAAEKKADRRPKKDRAIAAIREHFNLVPAAAAAGCTASQIEAWCEEDDAFARAVEEAQAGFIASVEAELLKLGKGEKKGSIRALTEFLAAHHPLYGRLKVELLRRVLDPIFELLMKLLKLEFGPESHDRLQRVQEKFEKLKQKRLVAFT